MSLGVEISGAWGLAALSLPVLALVAVALTALRHEIRGPRVVALQVPPSHAEAAPPAAPSASSPLRGAHAQLTEEPRLEATPALRSVVQHAASTMEGNAAASLQSLQTEPSGPLPKSASSILPSIIEAERPAAEVTAPARVVAHDGDLAERVARAEIAGEDQKLPSLYLDLARSHLTRGSIATAADLLRKSIRLATRLAMHDTHALARVELGDIAYSEGDLTTACEHWQIARGIYHKLKSDKEFKAAEARMLGNGCPTDWVLNDF